MHRPADRPSRLTEQVRATLARQRRIAKLQVRDLSPRSTSRTPAPSPPPSRTG